MGIWRDRPLSPEVLSLLVFVLTTGAGLSLAWLVMEWCRGDRRRVSGRVRKLIQEEAGPLLENNALFDTDFMQGSGQGGWAGWLRQGQLVLQQAGIRYSLKQFGGLVLGAGIVCGGGVGYLTGSISLGVLAGGGVIGGLIVNVKQKYQARAMLLIQQLPEAFELMSRTVRAGQTMSSAMSLAADHLQSPVADYFRQCRDQQALGIPFDRTVEDFADQVNVLEARMFCVALLLQRQAGGNPAEVLEKLARVIRRRLALEGKVKALTSEGRLQAWALTLLPISSFVLISLIDPAYTQRLLAVTWLFWGTVLSMVLGAWWIQRIISIEY